MNIVPWVNVRWDQCFKKDIGRKNMCVAFLDCDFSVVVLHSFKCAGLLVFYVAFLDWDFSKASFLGRYGFIVLDLILKRLGFCWVPLLGPGFPFCAPLALGVFLVAQICVQVSVVSSSSIQVSEVSSSMYLIPVIILIIWVDCTVWF